METLVVFVGCEREAGTLYTANGFNEEPPE